MVAGAAMLEAVDQVAQEREAAIRLYLLLVRALRALDGGPRDPSVVLDAFLLKLMALEGYRPALAECAGCGARSSRRAASPSPAAVGCASAAAAARSRTWTPPPCRC